MLRFRLRTLLILVAILSLALAAVVAPLLRHRREHAREMEIVAPFYDLPLAASIYWSRRSHWPPSSARLIGSRDDIFDRVHLISLRDNRLRNTVWLPDGGYETYPLEFEIPPGLFDRLPELEHLEVVYLDHCRVTPAEFEVFVKCHLHDLDLGGCQVDPRCHEYFDRLHELQMLSLSSLDLSATGILARVGAIPKLKELRLTFCEITDEGFDLLANINTLEELDLRRTPVTEHGLRALSRLPKLRILDLEESDIDPTHMAIVATYPSLEILTLSAESVTPEAATALTKSPNLKRVIIPDWLKMDQQAQRILLKSGHMPR